MVYVLGLGFFFVRLLLIHYHLNIREKECAHFGLLIKNMLWHKRSQY